MQEGGETKDIFLMPPAVYDSVRELLEWLRDENTEKHVSSETRDALEREITVLCKIPRTVPTRNPWVMVKYRYDGAYGSFKKRYLVTLVEYVIVALAKPTFYFSDEVGKYSEVEAKYDEFTAAFATPRQIESTYCEEYGMWSMDGEYTPYYSEEAKDALVDFFDTKSPIYDTERDELPDPESFRATVQEILAPFPMTTVLTWHDVISTGNKKRKDDLDLEFTDARLAALFLALAPVVDIAKLTANAPPHAQFEENARGTDATSLWTPDPYQWDQMQQECGCRDSWDDMCKAAKRVVSQKRLKF